MQGKTSGIWKGFHSLFKAYYGIVSFVVIASIAVFSLFLTTPPSLAGYFIDTMATFFIVGLYAILVPFGFSFYLSLFTLFLFPSFSIMVWALPRVSPGSFLLIITPAIAVALIFSVLLHLKTRNRDLSSSYFHQSNMFLFLIYTWSAVLIATTYSSAPQTSLDFFFFFGISLFIYVSVQITNMTFRRKELLQAGKVKNVDKLLEEYAIALEQKSDNSKSRDKDQIQIILHLFRQSMDDFVSGDFARSFENSYKILFDQYPSGEYVFRDIHKIENYDVRRAEFSPTRNDLIHTRKRDRAKAVRRELYRKALTLLVIAKVEYMDKIS